MRCMLIFFSFAGFFFVQEAGERKHILLASFRGASTVYIPFLPFQPNHNAGQAFANMICLFLPICQITFPIILFSPIIFYSLLTSSNVDGYYC